MDQLRYFRYTKELNKKYHKLLIEKELHFRGNENSFSLISISQKSPELGVKSGLKSIDNAEKLLKNEIVLSKPGRSTEEKNLQAYIISYAMNHQYKLPFGDLTLITSELAIKLDNNTKIVNDLLAIDSENKLVIIELKSIRSNEVKQQTIAFEEKVVNTKLYFIKDLVNIMTGKIWNGEVRKIAVWNAPKNESTIRKNEVNNVELYNYTFEGIKTKNSIVMNKVIFHKE